MGWPTGVALFHPPGAQSEKLNRHNPHRICLVNSGGRSDENGVSQWSLMVIIIINLYGSYINIQASGVIVILCMGCYTKGLTSICIQRCAFLRMHIINVR